MQEALEFGYSHSSQAIEIEDKETNKPISLKDRRILLVEDNEINQLVMNEILLDYEVQLDIADNGLKALEMLETSEYDIVLMDVQMPVMDGYEATQKIRQQSKWKHLPVIAMTAHAMEGDKEKCLQAGMNDYLTKPIDDEILSAALIKWIKS